MPAEVKQSPLADRVGPAFGQAYVEVFKELQGKEVEPPGGGGLPAGINNGIAHLKRVNFGSFGPQTKTAGKPYIQFFGVVHEPKEHNGIPIAGKQTKTSAEALCDTTDPNEKRERGDGKRRTLVEHLRHVVSLIKLLNGQEDPPAPREGEPWKAYITRFEQYCYQLCQRNLYFSFRTWQPDKTETEHDRSGWYVIRKGRRIGGPFGTEELLKKKYPNVGEMPQVVELWEQRVDYTPKEVAEQSLEDDTATAGNGQASSAGMKVVDEDTKYDRAASAPSSDGMPDLDALVAQAPDSEPARVKLLELAIAAGYSQDEVEAVDTTWEQVKDWIENPRNLGTEDQIARATESDPKEEHIPQKGQQTKTKVADPKVKGGREATCVITEVDTTKKTVDLKNTATKAVYKGVKWDQLIQG